VLLNYHIGRLVLSSLCVGDLVQLVLGVFVLQAEACLYHIFQTFQLKRKTGIWKPKHKHDIIYRLLVLSPF